LVAGKKGQGLKKSNRRQGNRGGALSGDSTKKGQHTLIPTNENMCEEKTQKKHDQELNERQKITSQVFEPETGRTPLEKKCAGYALGHQKMQDVMGGARSRSFWALVLPRGRTSGGQGGSEADRRY